MKQSRFFLIVVFYVLLLPAVCLAMKETDHDHENCDHGLQEMQEPDKHDVHSKHGDTDVKHKEGDDHDGHDHEQEAAVVLTDRAVEFAGLTIDVVNKKSIGRSIELPGEIGFNEDRLAHITPRYPGIVKKVAKQLGETIQKGELLAVVESNESLTAYTISSPISGKIVEKNVTHGEFVGEDATLFIIADLATVWVNCDVYAKDADLVEKGLEILITAVGTDRQVKTTLSYVAPVYNTTTRSMIARAVIPNTDGKWRPGTFITGKISVSTEKPVLVVSQNAVQILDGETVVFVPSEHKNGFEPVVVQKGVENNRHVEILSGLAEGDTYVATGAFELKAKIVTSTLGGHAGHGH
ncbi:MAG: efflux RND transporter periplasmic adaptor subunit [Desulfobacterales bacterium]|nr:efflux RND transporter periplasmic adaptor subunit [Desulfobacterales bacterium]